MKGQIEWYDWYIVIEGTLKKESWMTGRLHSWDCFLNNY